MTVAVMARIVVVLVIATAAFAQPDSDNGAATTLAPGPTVTERLDQGRAPGVTPGTPATTASALSTVSASSDRDATGQSSVSSTPSSSTSTLNAGRGTATPGSVPPATTQTTAFSPTDDADDPLATTVTKATSITTTTPPLPNGRLNESWVRAREPCYPDQHWLTAEDLVVGAVFQFRATDLGYALTDGPDGVVVVPCGDRLPATFRAVAPLVPLNSSNRMLLSLQVMSRPHLYLQRQALGSESVVVSALPAVDTQPPSASSALLLAVWEVHPGSGPNGTAVSFAAPDSDTVDGVLCYIVVPNKPPMATSPPVTFGPLRPSQSSSFHAIAPPAAPQTTLPPQPPPSPPTSGSSFPVFAAAAPVALVAVVAVVVLFLRRRRKPTRLQPLKLEEEHQYVGMVNNPMRAGVGAGDVTNGQEDVRTELQDTAVGGATGAARVYEEPVPQYHNQPWLPLAEYVEPLGAGTVAVAAAESYAYESAAPAPQTVAGTAAAAAATAMLPTYSALAAKTKAPVDYEPSLDSATSALDTDHTADAAGAASPAQYEAVKESTGTKGHEEVYSYATAGDVRRYQHLVPSYAEPKADGSNDDYAEPNADGPDDDESVYLQEDDADEPYDVPPLAPGVKLDGVDDDRPYDVPPLARRADAEDLPAAAAYSDLSASHGVYAAAPTTTDTPDWNSNA
eukprot:m.13321 g.13321  ORF g.13321 m.13321 type:complete len:680 (+) comp4522_c0_seq1:1167-3206(+)